MEKEIKKAKAIELLKQLNIEKAYIKGFEKEDMVCWFENFAGFWVYQDNDLMAKINEIEEEYKCLVYAVTHEYLNFGECYSMLIVPDYEEELDLCLDSQGNIHYAFSYVWNKTDDDCSEFGTIAVQNFLGGIRRIG